jgi:hypothetical protein
MAGRKVAVQLIRPGREKCPVFFVKIRYMNAVLEQVF